MYLLYNEGETTVIPADLKQTFENKFTMNVGQNEIIKMKNSGVITDRDLKVAKFLYRFRFATVEQIHKLLNEESSKANLEKRLDKLVKYRVLNKFMLGDNEEESVMEDALKIYCLDLGGKYLLSHFSNEDTTDWYSIVNMKGSEIISKNLLIAEFFIRLLQTCPSKIVHFKPEPELRVGKKNVIPSFELCLKVGSTNKYYVGEVVREFDFPIYLREKAAKLESLLVTNAWKKYYYDTDEAPVLLVFADSDLSALQASKLITETTEIESFRSSTDERINRPLYESGAFMKYVKESDVLREIKAVTFKP